MTCNLLLESWHIRGGSWWRVVWTKWWRVHQFAGKTDVDQIFWKLEIWRATITKVYDFAVIWHSPHNKKYVKFSQWRKLQWTKYKNMLNVESLRGLTFLQYNLKVSPNEFLVQIWYDMIYLLTAIGLSPGGRSTVHIYTQTIHRTIQNEQYIEQHNNLSGRVRAVPRLD